MRNAFCSVRLWSERSQVKRGEWVVLLFNKAAHWFVVANSGRELRELREVTHEYFVVCDRVLDSELKVMTVAPVRLCFKLLCKRLLNLENEWREE